MKDLVFATNNAHKLEEVRAILAGRFTVKSLNDIGCHEEIPEDADTLEGNALQKARYIHEHYGVDCFADDTGLEVEALGGAPGVYTARFGKMNGYGDSHDAEANINCLLDKLQGETNRRARFRTAIALVQKKDTSKNTENFENFENLENLEKTENTTTHLFEGIVEGEILTERAGTEGFGYDPIFAPEGRGIAFAEMPAEEKNAISHRGRATEKLVRFLLSNATALFSFLFLGSLSFFSSFLSCLALLPFLLASFCSLSAQAQQIGQWQVYPSYMDATHCVALGSTVYTQTAGNLFAYDADDESVLLFNSMEHLNDVSIAHIGVSAEAKRVIVVYESCNIDLLDNDGNVVNICALKDKSISGKTINALTVDGSTAYVGTGFGFITVDMQEGVIRDTYNLGRSITGILLKDGTPFLATDSKTVLTTKDDANWHLPSTWTETTAVSKTDIQNQGEAYAVAAGISWKAEGVKGLVGYKERGGEMVQVVGPIQPNSPVRDLFYRMNYVGDRLLVAGGINTPYAIYNPATAMIYEGGEWTFLDEETPANDYPKLRHYNTTHLTQDPNDPSHHFASPYRTGLYEYRNGKLVKIHSIDNSPLDDILDYGANYVSAVAPTYDADGNLWVLNNQTDTIIRILQPNGRWIALYYSEIAGTPTPDDYLFTRSGVRFIVSRRVDGRGFFGFDTNGTLTNTRDDKHVLRTDVVNQDGKHYDLSEFYCMTEDLDGRIWCGTIGGLFVINDPTRFFDNDFCFEQIKISRNDGSGLADYLLNGVSIRCIAVDGANRKWIGTQGNGLYLISADGQEMLNHFQTADSPLLSDNIQCIAVHPATGTVMIGTDRGLCSFVSDATEPEEELDDENVLAYPNPVAPDYTGPVTIKGLAKDTEVKICSSTGQLIHSGTSNGGTFVWNGCDQRGRRVSSGVYQVIANTPDGRHAIVTRIIVIK